MVVRRRSSRNAYYDRTPATRLESRTEDMCIGVPTDGRVSIGVRSALFHYEIMTYEQFAVPRTLATVRRIKDEV